MTRSLAWCNGILKWASVATLVYLGVRGFLPAAIPGLSEPVLYVLTSGAVGYLTNFLAIWLIFRPYEKVRWLGNLQGLIPREKKQFGTAIAEAVTTSLLTPDDLVGEFTQVIHEYLGAPSFGERAARTMMVLLRRRRREIAGMLLPRVSDALRGMVEIHLTGDNLSKFGKMAADGYFECPAHRRAAAAALVAELDRHSELFPGYLRGVIGKGAVDYVKRKHPFFGSVLAADRTMPLLLDQLDYEMIARSMQEKMHSDETLEWLGVEIATLAGRLAETIPVALAQEQSREFFAEKIFQVQQYCQRLLAQELPRWLRIVSEDAVLKRQLTEAIPALACAFAENGMRRDRSIIAKRLNLSVKIEQSVEKLDSRQLHQLVNQVSDRHLVAIQIIGYWLGVLAGLIFLLPKS
ncbi:MAG: DUF445 family protein [Victivallaceae bacterium]|nr:DUF445 family protein [Victivallaceae bacterium]